MDVRIESSRDQLVPGREMWPGGVEVSEVVQGLSQGEVQMDVVVIARKCPAGNVRPPGQPRAVGVAEFRDLGQVVKNLRRVGMARQHARVRFSRLFELPKVAECIREVE